MSYEQTLKALYRTSVDLWYASRVERHAEGHPGLPGPADGEPWDRERALLEGAIDTLQTIYQRKYPPAPETPEGVAILPPVDAGRDFRRRFGIPAGACI